MRSKDVFARVSGGTLGVVLAAAVPHLGCLAALAPLAVSTGIGASGAVAATYATGAMLVAGAGAAAWYGLRPSRAACCLVFGETAKVRLKKAAAIAACAFVAVAAFNTLRDNGPDIETRVTFMEMGRSVGTSVWEMERQLGIICGNGLRFGWK